MMLVQFYDGRKPTSILEVVRKIMDCHIAPHLAENTPLYQQCVHDVNKFIEACNNRNRPFDIEPGLSSLLRPAVETRSSALIRFLLANGANPNVDKDDIISPMQRAALEDYAGAMRSFLDYGGDIHAGMLFKVSTLDDNKLLRIRSNPYDMPVVRIAGPDVLDLLLRHGTCIDDDTFLKLRSQKRLKSVFEKHKDNYHILPYCDRFIAIPKFGKLPQEIVDACVSDKPPVNVTEALVNQCKVANFTLNPDAKPFVPRVS